MRLRFSLGFAVLAAIGLSAAAAFTLNLPGDRSLTLGLQGLGTSGWIEDLMRGVTWLGGTTRLLFVLAAAAGILILKRHHVQALALPLASFGTLMVPIMKELVDRPRPTPDQIPVLSAVGGHSFPSGHALTSITMLGALFYVAPYLCGRNRWALGVFRAILGITILAIGASRVYLGVHWTSDVIGGYLIGGLILFATIRLFEHLTRRLGEAPALAPNSVPT